MQLAKSKKPHKADLQHESSLLALPSHDTPCQAGSIGAKRRWRKEVVEGLARAACNLPADQASAAGLQIASPIVARLDSTASGRCSDCILTATLLHDVLQLEGALICYS